MNKRKERSDASEYRRIILKKAQDLFSEHGVDDVSMHQIAKLAGIGQGTLYRKYSNKGELCLDLMDKQFQIIHEQINLYLNEYNKLPVQDRLEKMCSFLIDFVEEQSQWLSAIKAPGCEENRCLVFQSPFYESLHTLFQKLLDEASQIKGFPTLDTVYTADVILAAMAPNLYLFHRRQRQYSINQIKQNIVRIYIQPLFKDL